MTTRRLEPTDTIAVLNRYTTLRDYHFGPGDEPADDSQETKQLPTWRGSKLGYCPVAQILHRQRATSLKQDDDFSLRRMEVGRELESEERAKFDRLGLLLGSSVKLVDPELELEGHIDIIWGGYVQEEPGWWFYRNPAWVDFLRTARKDTAERQPYPVTVLEVKKVSSYAFAQARIPKEGRQDHMSQLSGYYLLGKRHPEMLLTDQQRDLYGDMPDRWEVLILNGDTGQRRKVELTEDWIARTEDRIGLLNEAWKTGKWPTCECGQADFMAWEAKWCEFPNPSGDGCCGTTLLDLLEQSVTATQKPAVAEQETLT